MPRAFACAIPFVLGACAAPALPRALPVPAAAVIDPGAEHVRFPSRDGDLTRGAPTMLDAWLFRPDGPGPHPAVVALHGCNGLYLADGRLAARDHDWALRLRDQGYVVLLPDSFGPRGVTEICTRERRSIRASVERPRDAYGALAYLQALPFVRPDRVALLGWSNGGISVLATLAADSPARPRGLAHDFRVAVAFYPRCARLLDQPGWSPPAAPLTILSGASDDWTPAAPCAALAERARAAGLPVDHVVYPGAFHDFDAPGMPLHVKHHVATTRSHTATLGTDPAARADAIRRVTALFHDALF